jgi:integrase
MPAKGDGITKRKDGRYMARYTVHTPDGPKRKTIYGKKYKDVEKKLNEARANADKGLIFDADNLKASRRSVPLNKTAVAALRAHKLRQNEERLRSTGSAWRDADLVFPNRIGGPTDHNNLYYREYKPLLEQSGLAGEGFTFHTLRHTLATALFMRREHPKVVQSLLGHSSIAQTMDTYSHLMDGIGGDAVDGLDEAFG